MTGILIGKVALITGASSGIGEAAAIALAAEGAKVALAARRSERLENLTKRIIGRGGQAVSIVTDVSNEEQIHMMVLRTKMEWERIDILINSAGIMRLGQIDGANTEDWRYMVNVNVLGLMYATHAVLPIMKMQGGGHIVNISSLAGRTVRAGSAVYNATKWAVGAFSEALRQEIHRDRIRVTVIEPGAVSTELIKRTTDVEELQEGPQSWYQPMTPLKSEDIAAAIVYAVTQPIHVNVNEILIRPTEQDR